ncbi:uncharacterized protein LOC102372534 [Alligator sinensis]|uniref:Uncharacterized protein LOC102372534 n=1 Tax=Alligator sinensis TaxID=38654 RepID=A0A1U7SCL6_ALLSI|nr:uncharacterized protein LOC102372534 [Alligator sinensis]XP_025051200.1 uncharacterized protein LOC102372534 [Alligator sinensis]XP_025051201.1 uncharacterized protein LOC102372534 [Alligator sinensis]XP_025051202.1 uncharacterized protein LOC102372534 [Alligator sinensis]
MAAEEEPSHTMMKSELSYAEESKVREEAELLMGPEADWEKFLLLAPITVALLGQLVCITVEKGDFSIHGNAPSSGYKYFREPESFKVCLKEVCDRVWDAFQLGMDNAALISLQLKNVPKKMANLMQGFLQDANLRKDQLVAQIEGMQEKVDECKTLAKEVRAKFSEQGDALQELYQACLNAREDYKKELETMQKELEGARIQMEPAKCEQNRAELTHAQLEDQEQAAFEEFVKAVKYKPSILDALGAKGETQLMEKHTAKLEKNQEMLVGAQQDKESNYQRIKHLNEEMAELQCAVNRCELGERDLEGYVSSLEEGLEALRNLHQQCVKMVQFFQMISNLLDFSLNWHIRECLDSANDLQQVTQAFSTVSVAQLVQLISQTYATIVERYLMELLSQMGRLLGKDCSSFHTEKAQLDRGCEDAQEALTRLVGELKGNFQRDLSTRLETIEKVKLKLNP